MTSSPPIKSGTTVCTSTTCACRFYVACIAFIISLLTVVVTLVILHPHVMGFNYFSDVIDTNNSIHTDSTYMNTLSMQHTFPLAARVDVLPPASVNLNVSLKKVVGLKSSGDGFEFSSSDLPHIRVTAASRVILRSSHSRLIDGDKRTSTGRLKPAGKKTRKSSSPKIRKNTKMSKLISKKHSKKRPSKKNITTTRSAFKLNQHLIESRGQSVKISDKSSRRKDSRINPLGLQMAPRVGGSRTVSRQSVSSQLSRWAEKSLQQNALKS